MSRSRSTTRAEPPSATRIATLADLPLLTALLPDVEPESLARRVAGEDDGGIVLTSAATCSWTLDGGAAHLYDLAGDLREAEALVARVNELARLQLAAVLVTARYAGDPWLEALEATGFERDWSEPTVQSGTLRTLISLVRPVD